MYGEEEKPLHNTESQSERKRINVIGSDDEEQSQVEKKSKESQEETIEICGMEKTPDRLNFSELKVKSISKKSNNDVWSHFGHLYKNEKMIPMFQRKIACKHCFDKRILKW